MNYLQIVGAEILLCIPACVGLGRRTGVLSPASASANFCLACMVFAFAIWWYQIDLWTLRIGGIAFPITASHEANLTASHIYTFVILLTYCSTLGIRQRPDPTPSSWDKKVAAQTNKLARRASVIHSVLAPFICSVAAGHFFIFLLPNIDNYYFTDRSNLILAPLLLTSMIAGYYSLKLPKKTYFFLYLPTFIYSFAVVLGAYSRTIPLTFIILTICVAADTTIKKPWIRYLLTTFLAVLSVFFLVFALTGRTGRDEGLDYALVWEAMKRAADPANSSLLLAATTNVFHGVLLLAECIDTTGARYSAIYQILSLSPFPSAIDGWNDVIGEQIRINIYTPFNTFAETYLFGTIPQWAFIITYFACVRTMTRFYANNFGWRRAFITAFSLLCWALMQQYPVRNMFRILLLAAVLCYLMRTKRPKSQVRGRAPYLNARGVVPQLRVASPVPSGTPSVPPPRVVTPPQGTTPGALPKTN